ncbi:hypothetical protein ACFLXO_08350 [Chloroflexota bacterium]
MDTAKDALEEGSRVLPTDEISSATMNKASLKLREAAIKLIELAADEITEQQKPEDAQKKQFREAQAKKSS